ncbi:unnamed protein product, partial [Didymodactylos carnosus]
MKKICFIKDKVTQQPFIEQDTKKSTSNNSASNGVTVAVTETVSSRPQTVQDCSQDINKRIQDLIRETNEQKQMLNQLELEEIHETLNEELDSWKRQMYDRIALMHDKILDESNSSYDQLYCFKQTIQHILNDHLIQQIQKIAKKTDDELNEQDLDEIESKFIQLKDEINIIKELDLQLDSQQVKIVGELNIVKLTDYGLKKTTNQEQSPRLRKETA